jgi:hypothetical protein
VGGLLVFGAGQFRRRGVAFAEFKVNATPTFFINRKTYVGGMSFDELDKIIRPLT